MAELLGIGITHYPPLLGAPESYANLLRLVLRSHLIPDEKKNPQAWPTEMRQDWDNEQACAIEHQRRHREALQQVRDIIDDFDPDGIVIFGDDQYENFKQNIIPPFNIYCMDSFLSHPFGMLDALGGGENIWGLPNDYSYNITGDGQLGRQLADLIISRDFPIAYSYEFLNQKHLTHAFANALVFLDWDQKGWSYPIVPISVNCYGTGVVQTRGGMAQLFDTRPEPEKDPYLDTPGPAGPTPRSCFELGETLRSVFDELDGRYVIMASSGWSHAFLTEKHFWLYPDRDFDHQRLQELQQGYHNRWKNLTNDSIEDAGAQEFKNWICLAGAFPGRQATVIDYLDTWIFNSQKCFAVFPDSLP